jgi:hypothetical protein
MKKFLPHLPATGLTPVAAASAATAGTTASSAPVDGFAAMVMRWVVPLFFSSPSLHR